MIPSHVSVWRPSIDVVWSMCDVTAELAPLAFDIGLRLTERAFSGAVAVVCDIQRERVASAEGWDLTGLDDQLVAHAMALSDELG